MALSPRHTAAVSAAQPTSPLAMIVRVAAPAPRKGQPRHCAFIVNDVAEVMRPLPIERMANMPPFVLGVSIIRGRATPVIDTATLLIQDGDDRSERAAGDQDVVAPARFVVLRVGDRRVALAVEAVLGVRPLARQALGALPPLLQQAGAQVVSAIGALDSQLLTVLAGSYLVPPALWAALAPQEAAP